jgi:hypothetical protein
MLSKKSFLIDRRNFSGPLARSARRDVRDHIVSHKNDHGPRYRSYRALQQLPLCPQLTDIAEILRHVRLVPILLQKSFWGVERKFLEPLMRFTRGDVRDHIASSKIDHGPSWRL